MRWFSSLLGCILLSTGLAEADLSVRECIKAPTGGRWELPGDSQWRTVSSLDFNNLLSSDIVAQAAVTYHEGPGQAGVKVEYQLVLDGAASFTMQHRPNTGFPTTKMLRASFPDIAAGQHTLQLRARSISTFSAYFAQAWITPLLVEATEVSSSGAASASLTTPATNTWTTLVSTTVTPPAGKAVILGAYSAVTAGPVNQLVEYQILRGGTLIATFFDSVSSFLPSGQSFAVLDRSPGSSSVTYTLQARTIGGAATFSVRRLFSQTIPGDLTVYEGSASNVTIPADAAWHTIVSSPLTVLSASSSGAFGTKGFGFATVTYNGAYNNEALLRFLFMFTTPWEIGTVHVHGTGGKTVMEGLISDWEKLGFTPGGTYSVQLNAVGNCSSASSLSAKSARFQIVVLPDNDGFVAPYICPSNPQDCCPPGNGCTVYNCNAGTLATVSSPGIDCPIPP